MPLFLLFVLVPILELTVILKVHGHLAIFIGSGNSTLVSISVIILTGILGARYAKSQGRQVFRDIQTSSANGEMPTDALVRGFMLLVGGAMLLTPGYLTDFFGLSLLLPITQKVWREKFSRIIQNAASSQGRSGFSFFYQASSGARPQQSEYRDFSSTSTKSIDPDVIDLKPSDVKIEK